MSRSPLYEKSPYVDYNLVIAADRVRYHGNFSASHWLYQVLLKYEQGMSSDLRRDAFEKVLRAAISGGVKAAQELAATFPSAAGFPTYLDLEGSKLSQTRWEEVKGEILSKPDQYKTNRWPCLREGIPRYQHEGD